MGLTTPLFKPVFFLFILALLFTNTVSANPKILVWGDSLSAAYGIPKEKGWVNLLRQELGDDFEITNGSISGETTRGGLTRLPKALKKVSPDIIILELGANDGLRGLPPSITKNNLTKMIEKAQSSNAKVVLLGMKIPPNYGIAYANKFESVFSDLADKYKLPFVPFFLENVIEDLELLQEDELHPTAEAQPLILEKILPAIRSALLETAQK
ncbi:MAG: arylesterase [Kangiellaceae bacterium]|nr:arylesterase [Kangiellaceae bacterium]